MIMLILIFFILFFNLVKVNYLKKELDGVEGNNVFW